MLYETPFLGVQCDHGGIPKKLRASCEKKKKETWGRPLSTVYTMF